MSSVVGIERRRTNSIGIEEKALSTLEKFVELCDKGGCTEDDSEDGGGDESTDRPALPGSKSTDSISSRLSKAGSIQSKLNELFIDPATITQRTTPVESFGHSQPNGEFRGSTSSTPGQNSPNPTPRGSGATTPIPGSTGHKSGSTTPNPLPIPTKKSEEIWVRRVAGGRRSFRVTVST